MGLELSLKMLNEKDFDGFLHYKLKEKIANGVRMGINRAATGAKTEAGQIIPSVFNPKAVNSTRVKKDFLNPIKASGSDLASMKATIRVASTRGTSLIRFADQKRVQRQKKVAVKARADAGRITIKSGLTVNSKGAFILRAKQGTSAATGGKMIFRAGSKQRKGRLIGQHYKSIALMLQDDDVAPQYEQRMNERMDKEIAQAVGYELAKI